MKQYIYTIIIAACLLTGLLSSCIEDDKVPGENVTNADKPTLSDIRLTEKTASSITVKGAVTEYNGYPLLERGVCWGPTASLDISSSSHQALTDSNDSIIVTVNDLKSDTEYYFSLYAKNLAGIRYSDAKSTTTNDGLGAVHTYIEHKDTRATTAIAGGIIDDPGEGDILERGVYFAKSQNMAAKDSIISTLIKQDSFECIMTKLNPSTIYYVQAYVKNKYGLFKDALPLSLETGSGMPELNVIKSIEPKSNKAKVTAEVIHEGDAPVLEIGFCWTDQTAVPPDVSLHDTVLVSFTGDGIGEFSKDILPLNPNQKYVVSAFARNIYGYAYSAPMEFTTSSDLPTVVTLGPPIIDDGSVIMGGRVTDVGENSVIRVGICYSTSPMPGISGPKEEIILSPPLTEAMSPYIFSSGDVSGLKGSTTYYYRAYATNGKGTSYGDQISFQTPPVFSLESESFEGGPRVEGSSAYFVLGEKGYLLGGDIGPTYINNLYYYNPINSKRWSELTSYPAGRMKWISTAVIDDAKVYVLGGLGTDNVERDDYYLYNSIDNSWSPKALGPGPAYSRAGFSLNNEVVFVGGKKDTAKNEVWAYSVNTNTWMQKTDFPVNQYGGIAVNIDNNIYAGLGKNTAGNGNTQLWKSNGPLTTWTAEASGALLYGNVLAGTVYDGKIYVIDKLLSPERYTIFEYNPGTQVWKRKADLPNYSWSIQFMFTLRNKIYIGFTDSDKVVNYNPNWDN